MLGLLLSGALLSLAAVLLLRWWPPATSAFMMEARLAALARGDFSFHLRHTWVDRGRIAATVQLAVIASEDQKFPFHHGFDFDSIQDAMREQEDGMRARGASTISQQTAKNLFLWGGHSYVRKALEAWFTLLLELCWPKARILEVYLNSAQFGPDVYGVEAAALSLLSQARRRPDPRRGRTAGGGAAQPGAPARRQTVGLCGRPARMDTQPDARSG